MSTTCKKAKESAMGPLKRRQKKWNGGTESALPVPAPFTIQPPQEEDGAFMQLLLGEENDED